MLYTTYYSGNQIDEGERCETRSTYECSVNLHVTLSEKY
jgi:hypothetical protein